MSKIVENPTNIMATLEDVKDSQSAALEQAIADQKVIGAAMDKALAEASHLEMIVSSIVKNYTGKDVKLTVLYKANKQELDKKEAKLQAYKQAYDKLGKEFHLDTSDNFFKNKDKEFVGTNKKAEFTKPIKVPTDKDFYSPSGTVSNTDTFSASDTLQGYLKEINSASEAMNKIDAEVKALQKATGKGAGQSTKNSIVKAKALLNPLMSKLVGIKTRAEAPGGEDSVADVAQLSDDMATLRNTMRETASAVAKAVSSRTAKAAKANKKGLSEEDWETWFNNLVAAELKKSNVAPVSNFDPNASAVKPVTGPHFTVGTPKTPLPHIKHYDDVDLPIVKNASWKPGTTAKIPQIFYQGVSSRGIKYPVVGISGSTKGFSTWEETYEKASASEKAKILDEIVGAYSEVPQDQQDFLKHAVVSSLAKSASNHKVGSQLAIDLLKKKAINFNEARIKDYSPTGVSADDDKTYHSSVSGGGAFPASISAIYAALPLDQKQLISKFVGPDYKGNAEVRDQFLKEIAGHPKMTDTDKKNILKYAGLGDSEAVEKFMKDNKGYKVPSEYRQVPTPSGYYSPEEAVTRLNNGQMVPVSTILDTSDGKHEYQMGKETAAYENVSGLGFKDDQPMSASKATEGITPHIDYNPGAGDTGTAFHLLAQLAANGEISLDPSGKGGATNVFSSASALVKKYPILQKLIDPNTGNWDGKRAIPALKNLYSELNRPGEKQILSEKSLASIYGTDPKHRKKLAATIDNLTQTDNGYVLKDYKYRTANSKFKEWGQLAQEKLLVANAAGAGILDLDQSKLDAMTGRIVRFDEKGNQITSDMELGTVEDIRKYQDLSEEYKKGNITEEEFFRNLPPQVQEYYADEMGSIGRTSFMGKDGKQVDMLQLRIGKPDKYGHWDKDHTSSLSFDDNGNPTSGNRFFSKWEDNRDDALKQFREIMMSKTVPQSYKDMIRASLIHRSRMVHDPKSSESIEHFMKTRNFAVDMLGMMPVQEESSFSRTGSGYSSTRRRKDKFPLDPDAWKDKKKSFNRTENENKAFDDSNAPYQANFKRVQWLLKSLPPLSMDRTDVAKHLNEYEKAYDTYHNSPRTDETARTNLNLAKSDLLSGGFDAQDRKDFTAENTIEYATEQFLKIKDNINRFSDEQVSPKAKNDAINMYFEALFGKGNVDLTRSLGQSLGRMYYTADIYKGKDKSKLSPAQQQELALSERVRDIWKNKLPDNSTYLDAYRVVADDLLSEYNAGNEGFFGKYGRTGQSFVARHGIMKETQQDYGGKEMEDVLLSRFQATKHKKRKGEANKFIGESNADEYFMSKKDKYNQTAEGLVNSQGWTAGDLWYDTDNNVWLHEGVPVDNVLGLVQTEKTETVSDASKEELGNEAKGKTNAASTGGKEKRKRKASSTKKISQNASVPNGSSGVSFDLGGGELTIPKVNTGYFYANAINITNAKGDIVSGGSGGGGGRGRGSGRKGGSYTEERQEIGEFENLLKEQLSLKNSISSAYRTMYSGRSNAHDVESAKNLIADKKAEMAQNRTALQGYINDVNKNGSPDMKASMSSIVERYQKKEKWADQQNDLKGHGITSLFGSLKNSMTGLVKQFTQFGAAYMIIGKVKQAISEVVTEAGKLNKAMTNIQIVTGDNESQARALMQSYSGLASQLSATTEEVATAANDWLRQGMTVADTNALITDSIHLSTLGMITQSEATQDLTSIMKGYKLSVSEVGDAVDKLTAVDMKSASSAGGIAQALQQVANVANEAGVSLDQSIGMISTISDVTQREPSSVGQSLRTMMARFGNVKAGAYSSMNIDSDNEEATSNVNDIEKVLSKLGIAVRSSNLEFRDFDDVLGDVAEKWDTIDSVSKNAIATAMAGVRNREQFVALMSNWDKYQKLTEVSATSAGTAEKKYLSYTEQLEAAQKRVKAAWESIAQNSEFDKFLITVNNVAERLVKNLPNIVKWLVRIFTSFKSYKIPSMLKYSFLGGSLNGKTSSGVFGKIKNSISHYNEQVAGDTTARRTNAYTMNSMHDLSILPKSATDLVQSNTDLGAKIDRVSAILEKRSGRKGGAKSAKGSGTPTGTTTTESYSGPLPGEERQLSGEPGALSMDSGDGAQAALSKGSLSGKINSIKRLGHNAKAKISAALQNSSSYRHSAEFASTLASNVMMGVLTAPTSGQWTNSITHESETRDMSEGTQVFAKAVGGGLSGLGTAIGSIGGPLGAALGGTIGQLGGDLINKYLVPKLDEENNKLQDVVDNGEKTLSAMSSISDDISSMKDLSSEGSWSSDDYETATSLKQSMITTLNASGNEQAKKDFIEHLNKSNLDITGSGTGGPITLTDAMNAFINGDASDRKKISSAFELAQKQTTSSAYIQSQAKEIQDLEADSTVAQMGTGINLGSTALGAWSLLRSGQGYSSDTVGGGKEFAKYLTDAAAGTSAHSTSTKSNFWEGFASVFGYDVNDYQFDTSDLSNQERIDLYTKALEEADKDNNTDAVAKFNDILDDLEAIQEKQDEINDSINDNTVATAMLQASDTSNGVTTSLTSMTTLQLQNLGINKIRQRVAEALSANGGLQGHDIWLDANKTQLTDYAENLIDNELKSYDTIYGVVTGQSYTLDEMLGLTDEKAKKEYLESYASALGVTVEELKTLKDTYGDMTLGDVLSTPEDLRTKLSSYADILGQIASSAGLTKETLETIVSDFPELMQYVDDPEALAKALMEKTANTESLYKTSTVDSIMGSADAFKQLKEAMNSSEFGATFAKEFGSATSFSELFSAMSTTEDTTGTKEAVMKMIDKLFGYSFSIKADQTAVNNAISYQTKMYDKQIDSLNEQKDALSKINDQREYGNKLIEAQLKLENAQKDKKRVYRAGIGWSYEADQESIKSAQDELDDLDIEKQTDLLQTEIDELTAQKTLLTDLADNDELENLKASYDAWAESNGVINSDQAKILETIQKLYDSYTTFTVSSEMKGRYATTETNAKAAETAMNTAYSNYINNPTNDTLQTYQEAVDAYKAYDTDYKLSDEAGTDQNGNGAISMADAYSKEIATETPTFSFDVTKGNHTGNKLGLVGKDPLSASSKKAGYILADAQDDEGYYFYEKDGAVIQGKIDPDLASDSGDLQELAASLYTLADVGKNPIVLLGDKGDAEWAAYTANGLRRLSVSDANSTSGTFYSAALGSLSLPGAATLVNELGTEAIVTPYGTMTSLPSGTGVVPADLTKNLYDLGSVSPSILNALGEYKSDLSSGVTPNSTTNTTDDSLNITGFTMNVNADGSFDPDAFVEQLKQAASLTKRNH